MKIYRNGITHGGIFHADDVFSTALLRIISPDFQVKRVFEVPEDHSEDEWIIYDIGRGKYDHHGEEAKYHENGKMFAAFGLLWEEYGTYVTGSEKIKKDLENDFVSLIDETDNGGEPDLVSMVISSYNPLWNSGKNTDEAFEEAVNAAYDMLVRLIEKEKAAEAADAEVMEAYSKMKDNIVILKRFAPWSKILSGTDAEFVVYPSARGGYNVQGVPVSSEKRDLKVPFPESWRGLEKEKLEEVSGIKGLVFCHRSGFLAVSVSQETAVEAALAASSER